MPRAIANIAAAAGVAVLAVAAVVSANPARAQSENWVQVDPNTQAFYDSVSVFVDTATGYVVYNSATDFDATGEFNYMAVALDCDGRRYFVIGWVIDNSGYEVDPGWETDPTRVKYIEDGTLSTLFEQALCPGRAGYPTGTMQ
jgi:hypothetical protein